MKRGFLVLLLLITIIVVVPAVSFSQEVIESQSTDMDLRIYEDQFFKIGVGSATTFDADLDVDIFFRTRTISQDSENFLNIRFGPELMYDHTDAFSLDVDGSVEYGNQIYFTLDSTFPIGLEIVPTVEAAYSNDPAFFVFETGLYLAFLGGRVVDQRLLLDAKILSDALGVTVSNEVLRKIAERVVSFHELYGTESDAQVEQFASELASLLDMAGQELKVYATSQQILEHRYTRRLRSKNAQTGFQFKIGTKTDFVLSTANLQLTVLPELTFAGNLGDAVWFDMHGRIELPAVNATFDGSTPDAFSLDKMDGVISIDLNWYISPDLSLNIGTDGSFRNFLSDPADPATPTPSAHINSTIALDYSITDSLKLEIDFPITLVPKVAVDFGVYVSWDIL